VTTLVACASTRPPPPAPPIASAEPKEPETAAAASEAPPMTEASFDAPERSRPPSTASYDEALAIPEPVDVDDDRRHLTDTQLTSPMNGALTGCTVPANAKITIKVAVQNGRAIGVTVDIHLERPRPAKAAKLAKRAPEAVRTEQKPTKAERRSTAKVAACVDHNVRAVVWPPNHRRDSFTMVL
jgi:hypothetical protein